MFVQITTKRLILRPLGISDLETVHEYASDIENTKYMMYLPNNTLEETLRFLTRVTKEWQKDESEYFEFAITLDDKQIGAISVSLNENRTEGELGWILNKKYWGRGYATEAAIAVKEFAVNELKISSLIAHCDYRNNASRKVMEKIGMTLVSDDGIRQYPKTGEISKELVYSIRL